MPQWAEAPTAVVPLAGTAGRAFARLVSDASGSLDVQFWNATQVVLDDRVPPQGKDISVYRFWASDDGGDVSVEAKLVYLRFVPALAAAKGWSVSDFHSSGGKFDSPG